MQLSLERIQQLSQQYLSYLQHRRLVGRAAAPHPPTNAESRKLQTWIALFFMSGQMASGLAEYLRKESRDRRTQRMTQVYRGYMHGVDAVMNEDLLAQARSLLPDFDPLNATSPIDPSEHAFPLASDDVKAIQLVKWFKHDFMHWVDPIKCPSCAGDTTHQSSSGHESMTAEERQVAGRLEVWKCNDSNCGGIDRFLRLNDLSALLKSRRGRCGEFANLFTLFLHAAALQWRIVVNAEDHVWNEYWSASAQRWIHMDPSEGSADQPLVYDLGWGKKQSYCIAFGPTGGKDVTRGYVSDWEDVGGCQERRTLWMEDDLNDMIKRFTDERRSKLQLHQAPWLPSVNELEHQDVKEEDYLADYRKRVADAKKHAFGGRSSGTLDWRAQRKEIGGGASAEEVIPIDIGNAHLISDMSSSLVDLCLYGSADIRASDENEENTVLSLTPLETDKTGSAFLVTELAASDSYVADITFRIRKRKGQEGADGMGVATMSVPSEELSLYREAGGQVRVMGDGGAGLGYTGLGTPDDFAIEIDTYRSVDRCNDPPTPHISLHQPANSHHKFAKACTAPNTIPDLADGHMYGLRIQHQVDTIGGNQVVSTWLRTIETRKESRNTEEEMELLFLWQVTIPIAPDTLDARRVLAFTAATGGFAQAHEILSWQIYGLPYHSPENEKPVSKETDTVL